MLKILFIFLYSPVDNPLHCSCDSQELWEWLRDHPKWLRDDHNSQQLRCELPHELRGQIFIAMEPHKFCDIPLILKLAIQDIQPFSVLVSWQSREHSGLHGYQILYHSLDEYDEVSTICLKKIIYLLYTVTRK